MAIKRLNTLQKDSDIVDLTSATTDYSLAVGETATITYTSATNVPLHVATVEGIYNVMIVNASTGSTTYTNDTITLRPNNTTVTAGDINWSRISHEASSIVGSEEVTALTAFYCGNDTAGIFSDFTIITFQSNKSIRGAWFNKTAADKTMQFLHHQVWFDTSTAWTSLGTVIIPSAQSGKIVIRRIA